MATYGIDASSANKERRTGVEEYAFQLIEHLKHEPLLPGERIVLYTDTPLNTVLRQMPSGWSAHRLRWPFSRGWRAGRLSLEMLLHKPDVLFVPGQRAPLCAPKATCVTVHDIGFHSRPDLYEPKERTRLLRQMRDLRRSSHHLFAVSQFTKHELFQTYGFDQDRITVTPNASVSMDPIPEAMSEEVLRAYGISPPYLLFIGRIEKKKNLTTLIQAFHLYKQTHGFRDPLSLVMIGADGYGAYEVRSVKQASMYRDEIHLLGFVPIAHRNAFLSRASALVFPSWYEGFGMPILEAMQAGVPVIASDIPPHREVAGEAARFAKPGDVDAWARVFASVLGEAAEREALVAKGHERAVRFSWQDTAKTALITFRRLCTTISSRT